MELFYFLLILCILLIAITIVATIIKTVLFLTTKINYTTRTLFIPAILNIFTWSLVFYFLSFIIFNILNINLGSLLLNTFILKANETQSIIKVIIAIAVGCIIGIILQSFAYFCINIDYKNIFRNTRWLFKKKVLKTKKNDSTNIALSDNENKITFSNAFVASLFSFTLILFFVFILFNIGTALSQKII
jgi:hypothetical protein